MQKKNPKDGDSGWPEGLGVKYLSHWNQCQIPIDFSHAWMLPLAQYLDAYPQKFIQLSQMAFIAVLNPSCLRARSSAENPLQLPGALFHLIFPPAAKPVKERFPPFPVGCAVPALHWGLLLEVFVWPLVRHIRDGSSFRQGWCGPTDGCREAAGDCIIPWGGNDRKGCEFLKRVCCQKGFSWTYTLTDVPPKSSAKG